MNGNRGGSRGAKPQTGFPKAAAPPRNRLQVELYPSNDAVAATELVFSTAIGAERRALLVALAWKLRQRDSRRALALVDEAERSEDAFEDASGVRARLLLVRAEASTLLDPETDYDSIVNEAARLFRASGDFVGEGDAYITAVILAHAQGDMTRVIDSCQKAHSCFERGRDPLRAQFAEAWLLFYRAFRSPGEVAETTLRLGPRPTSAGLDALFESIQGVLSSSAGALADASAHHVRAAEKARQAGMIRHAIVSAMNAAGWMQELGDYDGASSCIAEALAVAQATSWPSALGLCYLRLGELLRLLGQFERSHDALRKAFEYSRSVPSGANKAAAHEALGQTLLSLKQADGALEAFRIAAELFEADGHMEGVVQARIGEARALSLANRVREALEAIESARVTEQKFGLASHTIQLQIALANIYRIHSLPLPEGVRASSATTYFLERALEIGSSTEAWNAPASILADLSDAWSEAGDSIKSLEYLRRALAAERQQHNRTAAAQAITLESRIDAHQLRIEAEHQRNLATIAAARSMALERDVYDRTTELERLRQESTKAAARTRALWRVAASDRLGDEEYVDVIVRTVAETLRPGVRLMTYLSELRNDHTVAQRALALTFSGRPLSEMAVNFPLAGSFEELLLDRHGTSAVTSRDHAFSAAHPLTDFHWHDAVGCPIRIGATTYFLIIASPTKLREPIAEDDIAFVDVVSSFFALRFGQTQQFERIRFQIEHDALTGLTNRVQLRNLLRRAIRENEPSALCFIDINDFSDVNEANGFVIGDEILVEVAASLRGVRSGDAVARFGGDIFAVLISNVSGDDDIREAALPYQRVFDHPFGTGDRDGTRTLSLTCSIGIASFPTDATTAEDLLLRADAALSSAKLTGGSSLVSFASIAANAIDGVVLRRTDFVHALENDQLFLEYQPTFTLDQMKVTGAEALIRWRHPLHGDLQPAAFLPAIDRIALLHGLSSWVLRRIVRDLSSSSGLPFDFRCYMNLAPQQLDDIAFIDELRSQLEQYPALADHLGIEITETAAMRNIERSVHVIEMIRDLGLRVAIDDFGTGFSSLNYLKRLPVDVIKIDRAFVAGLPGDSKDALLTQTLLDVAHSFGFTTLAEGIETTEQLEWLKQHGCSRGQGFLVSRPIAFRELEALLWQQLRGDDLESSSLPQTDQVGFWEFSFDDAEAASAARHSFVALLHTRQVLSDAIAKAELVFGEMLGNVVRHAPGPVQIALIWPPEGPFLIVRDHGRPFEVGNVRLPEDDFAESRRGVFLITQCSSRPFVTRNIKGGKQTTVSLDLPTGSSVSRT